MDTEREKTEIEMTQQETQQDAAAKNTTESREESIRREYDFAPDVKLKECRYCRVMIPKKAKVCPNCRMSLKRYWFRNLVAAVVAVIVIGVGGYYLSEHWGIMRDAVASVWRAQDDSAVPVVSVTTVDTTRMAAGASTVETAEVTNLSEAEPEKAAEAAERIEAQSNTHKAEIADTEAAEEEKSTKDGQDTGAAAEEKSTEDGQDIGAAEEEKSTKDGQDTEAAEEEKSTKDGQDIGAAAEEEKSTKDGQDTGATEEERSTEDGQDTGAADNAIEDAEDAKSPVTAASAKSMDRQEREFREECALVGYKSLLRDTEEYLDTALMVELQVVCQVNGGLFDENIYYLCKTEDGNNIVRYYIVRDDRETDDTLILEGDILTVFGQLFGTCKLPADLLETRPTVPAVSMLYYDLTGE